MPFKWIFTVKKPPLPPPGRSVSAVLLDFVFGQPVPQPEVVELDGEQAWNEWLEATVRRDAEIEFEDTQPMAAGRSMTPLPN